MSTSVLDGSSASRARPFAWRTVALSGETRDRRRGAADGKGVEIAGASSSHPLEERIAELERGLEQRAREARDAGFREGEAAAQERADENVRSALERLAQSIAEVHDYRSSLLRQAETDAVRLSIAIARRVLRRELTVDPAALEGLVRAALEKLQSQDTCRVRMHPDYIPALHAAMERVGISGKVDVIPDNAQEPGAAVFEMIRGNLDASMDSQLREIERGLADRFQRPW